MVWDLRLCLLLMFVLEWFYPVIGEVYFRGASPGKHLLGLRVVHDNGTPVGFSASMIRNLLRFVDFLPALYAFGLLSMFASTSFKRLGDWAAGTVVVYKDEVPIALVGGADDASDHGRATASSAPAVIAPFELALSEGERTTLRDLFDRRAELGEPRFAELAAIPTALTENAADPVARLEELLEALEHGTIRRPRSLATAVGPGGSR